MLNKDRAVSLVASSLKRIVGRLGPGLITGASDDDPSGIGTYSQAGAQVGFRHRLDDAAHLSLDGVNPGD